MIKTPLATVSNLIAPNVDVTLNFISYVLKTENNDARSR